MGPLGSICCALFESKWRCLGDQLVQVHQGHIVQYGTRLSSWLHIQTPKAIWDSEAFHVFVFIDIYSQHNPYISYIVLQYAWYTVCIWWAYACIDHPRISEMCFSFVRFEVWRMRCWKILALPCVAFYGMTTRWKLMQFDNFESIFGLWHHYLIWFQESKDCFSMLFDALVTVCVFCSTCKVGMLERMKTTWNWYHFPPHTFLATALTTWWCHKTQQVLNFLQRGRSTLAYQQRQEQFGTESIAIFAFAMMQFESIWRVWIHKWSDAPSHQVCPDRRNYVGAPSTDKGAQCNEAPSWSNLFIHSCRWPAQLHPQRWMQKSSLDSCWRQHPNVKESISVEYIAIFQNCFKYLEYL